MRGSRDLARSLTTLKARYLAVNFIGLAMIAAVFVYAGVVELIKWQLAPFAGFAKLDPHTVALTRQRGRQKAGDHGFSDAEREKPVKNKSRLSSRLSRVSRESLSGHASTFPFSENLKQVMPP